jgi:hypothetical protein
MRSIPVLLVALMISSGSSLARRSVRPQITGLYSNMAFTSSGDLGGVQLFVTRADTSFYVQFQMAEGDTDVPILMSLQVQDSTISFAFPTDTKYSTGLRNFRGTISRAGISGKFANGYAVNLPRLECSRR